MARSVSDEELTKTFERIRSDLSEDERPTRKVLKRFLGHMSREFFPEDDGCVFWTGPLSFHNATFSIGPTFYQTRRLIRFWFVEDFAPKGGARRKLFRTCADDATGKVCCRADHCVSRIITTPTFKNAKERSRGVIAKGKFAGSSHPSSKIPRETVEVIWKDCTDGVKAGEIAKKYGVSTSTVYNIRKGKSWASVTGMTKEYVGFQEAIKKRQAEERDLKHDRIIQEMWTLDFRPGLPDDRKPTRSTMAYVSKMMKTPFRQTDDRCVPYPHSRFNRISMSRHVYDWFVGDIQPEDYVLRTCQDRGGANVNCINPMHLQLSANSRGSSSGKRKREGR